MFGKYADKFSRNGAAFIRGLQDFGISATAKHFPGNDSVIEDPHEKLFREERGIDSVRNTIAPFKRALLKNPSLESSPIYYSLMQIQPLTLALRDFIR